MSNFLFNTIRVKRPPRNVFDLSFENDLSTNFGKLTPIFCKEVLPGDKFKINTSLLVKLAPMVAPAYVRIDAYLHFFFVPNRLLFKEWEDFITNKVDKSTQLPILPPMISHFDNSYQQFVTDYVKEGSLMDYLNVPIIASDDIGSTPVDFQISALPFIAYQKIYNDYYRNQFFEDETIDLSETFYTPTTGEIDNDIEKTLLTLRYRNWSKDYFTSSLPTTQYGDEMLLPYSLPEIVSDGFPLGFDGSAMPMSDDTVSVLTSDETSILVDTTSQTPLEYKSGLKNKLSDEQSITINDLRRAIRVQEFNEKTMRGGNRYIEQIFSHFGVKSSDSRLQRAQYLGGSKTPIVVSDIYQNSETTETSPIGHRAGIASGYSSKSFIKYFSEEHGFIIGILSIMPHSSYMQGLHKMYTRRTWLDYAFPEFANLGEQSVNNHEIFLDWTKELGTGDNDNETTFGYLPRYAEYKTSLNEIHGDFRSSLNFWHSARIFSECPALNNEFLKFKPDNGQDRIFALQDGSDKFYVQLFNNCYVTRNLSKYGTPTL